MSPRLKKKLHLTKLIKFLNKYNYLLFYQCNTTTHQCFSPLCKLFLTKLIRIQRLSSVDNKVLQEMQSIGNPRQKNQNLALDGSHCAVENLRSINRDNTLRIKCNLLTLWATVGNCILVGCHNLQQMQDCIKKQSLSNHKLLCIGAIYQNKFVNGADCVSLSKISYVLVYTQLLKTFDLPATNLFQRVTTPGRRLSMLLLMHRSQGLI